MNVALVAAVADNDVIGDDGTIPWNDAEWAEKDLQHFRDTTTDHPVIMGRKTYESLPDEYTPLPDRYNIVLSTIVQSKEEAVTVTDSIEKSLQEAETFLDGREEDTAYVIGGRTVYEQFLTAGLVDELILTEIREPYPGDTTFPPVNWEKWEEQRRDVYDAFDIATYTRRS